VDRDCLELEFFIRDLHQIRSCQVRVGDKEGMEWTGVGSPKKRKEATDLAVAAGGVVDQVGLVTLHKKPRRVNEAHPTAREKVEEEEGDGTENVTTALSSMPASARIDAPSPPSPLQRPPPRPEADAAIDRGGAGEVVVEELTTVAELVKKGGSGLLVRRPALGHRLAVFWRRDRPFVINDACPHRGGTHHHHHHHHHHRSALSR
jgi:hypothetical protein